MNITFLKAFLIVCTTIAAIQIFTISLFKDNEYYFNHATRTITVGIAIAFILSTLLFTYFYKIAYSFFSLNMEVFKFLIPGFFLIYGINIIVSNTLSNYLEAINIYEEFSSVPIWAMLISVVIIRPICEEIIFRGIILRCLLNSYQSYLALFYSAFLFSMGHMGSNLITITSSFFIGLAFGWIFIKTRSLSLCIFIHSLNNLMALYILKTSMPSDGVFIKEESALLFIGLLMTSLGVLFFKKQK